MTMNGVDLSNNNGSVDWTGVEFAFYKATEGVSFVDRTQATWAGKVVGGPYHFAHPDQNSPDNAAAFFLANAIPGQVWALDCETRKGADPLAIMGASSLAGWCDRFYQLVAPTLGPNGYHYTFRSYADHLWPILRAPWRWWLASASGRPGAVTHYAGRVVDIEQWGIVNGVDRDIAYTPLLQGGLHMDADVQAAFSAIKTDVDNTKIDVDSAHVKLDNLNTKLDGLIALVQKIQPSAPVGDVPITGTAHFGS